MSLNNVSMKHNIKNQVRWKLSSYSSAFMTIIAIQIISSLIFSNGTTYSSLGSAHLSLTILGYSLDGILMFSMLTLFIISTMLASKQMTQENFSIVTTRLTASISTVITQLVLCFIATWTALSSFYIFALVHRLRNSDAQFLIGRVVEVETILLFFSLLVIVSAAGFFAGSFLQMNKWIISSIGVLIVIGLYVFIATNTPTAQEALVTNTSMWTLIFKCLIISTMIYGVAIYIRNLQEVSRR
ncbi:hypothetical protein [Lysinibacillus sp. LZ02]|uniref:hypothetical protein n=1 Tax=Lysinibacillus sp. LZ02 TaxID=3420668 RepID=UPI003D35DBE1